MIDERLEELASLYVLGALPDVEAREFELQLSRDPRLQAFVARLNDTAGALAGSVAAVPPPAALRDRILSQTAPKVAVTKRASGLAFWMAWTLAAGLAAACVVLNLQDSQLRRTIDDQARRIDDLTRLTESLQSSTKDLRATVMALQESNRLGNVKIALLNSLLADAPKTVAVSLWDEPRQDGVFMAQNLKALPADRDYQLWVLEGGTTPVDAGVFHVDEHGKVRVDFKAKKPVKIAARFAVTEEVKGGAASPTLAKLVLASD